MNSQEEIIDLTHEINAHTLPYPGDPTPDVRTVADVVQDGFSLTLLSVTSHTGTHVDAPAHVLPQGRGIEKFTLDEFIGEACVLDLRPCQKEIDINVLDGLSVCDWLLLCTGQSNKWGGSDYFENGPVFTESFVRGAASLTRKGIGMDCAGLDRTGVDLHRIWFECGGGLILENLKDMDRLIGRAVIRFVAVPLRLGASDGAPVRAFACCKSLD